MSYYTYKRCNNIIHALDGYYNNYIQNIYPWHKIFWRRNSILKGIHFTSTQSQSPKLNYEIKNPLNVIIYNNHGRFKNPITQRKWYSLILKFNHMLYKHEMKTWLWYQLLENLVLYLIQNTQRKQQTWIYFIHDW